MVPLQTLAIQFLLLVIVLQSRNFRRLLGKRNLYKTCQSAEKLQKLYENHVLGTIEVNLLVVHSHFAQTETNPHLEY